MISKIYVQNFKSLKDIGWVSFSPMTLLTGVNSCGKTSFIQSLLLLKQTLLESNPDVILNPNGALVQLGSFKDIVFNHDIEEPVKIGFELSLESPIGIHFLDTDFDLPNNIRFVVSFSYDKEKKDIFIQSFELTLFSNTDDSNVLNCEFCRNSNGTYTVTLNSDVFCKFIDFDVNDKLTNKLSEGKKIKLTEVGMKFRKFFPMHMRVDRTELHNFIGISKSSSGSDFVHAFFVLIPAIQDLIETELDRVTYIGPLREEPKRYYFYNFGRNLDIGKKGEFAAQILFLESKDKIKYYKNLDETEECESTLEEAVKYWLCDKMGITSRISIDSLSEAIYEVKLDKEVSISNVGFGVSQVLPIVVEGLRRPKGSTLMFEQPEIHLHPKMQAELADFFICLAKSQKKVIIETHSDHLINRFKRRIVEDTTGTILNKLGVYFVENVNNKSIFQLINVDEFGCADKWPEGFFDQTDLENRALLRAQFAKRKMEGEKNA